MTRSLEKAVSFFTAIKHLKGHDCANFIKHLDDKGIYKLRRKKIGTAQK